MAQPVTSSEPTTAPPAAAPEQSTSLATRAPVRMGIAPRTIDEGWRVAQYFAKSELVPKNFRNKPEDVLVAIQCGMELGLSPFQALASIAVINGRAGVWGDGFLALIVSSPLYKDHDEFYEVAGAGGTVERRDGLTVEDLKKDATAAVCTFWRRGKTTPVTRRFSVGQAKKANLLGKDGPWQTYPDRMLAMRARSFAGRDTFPDLLRGVRPAEELRDLLDDDAPAAPVVAEVRRVSEQRRDLPAAAAPAAAPAPAPELTLALDPARVKGVEAFLGGFVMTLDNGMQIDIETVEDATELEKFVGTDHKIRATVDRLGNACRLRTFAIAD